MTIIALLKEKGLSRYSLSKKSGVPWATLSDICSGKTSLSRCNAQTVLKLSKVLDLSIEEVLKLSAEVGDVTELGKPKDKSYLERNICAQNISMEWSIPMIDFTDCAVNKFKAYGGANGNKINVLYNGTSYMLKFPPIPSKSKVMSYSNSCISEYLACHILASIGLLVQDTLLGTYTDKRGKEKLVVACKDFTADGKRLMEFAHLKNTCVDSEQNGYCTELDSILKAIDEQVLIPVPELRAFFWELFVADAWLGNFDRHNGNWGILIDEQKQHAEIAPIYDCGSCLYPQMDVRDMAKVLGDESEINQRIYTFPTSAIVDSGKKISYFDFMSSLQSTECGEALERIAGRIDMEKVCEIIAATPAISDLQKDFYQTMLTERKEKILDYSMALRMKQQGNAQAHKQ